MNQTPPLPVCTAFLACNRIEENPQTKDKVLIGLPRAYHHHFFPNACPIGFFIRLTEAHGNYRVEVQLQTPEGEVVWHDGPLQAIPLDDPLLIYDLTLNVCVVFPQPGTYDLVLMVNGEELSRQRFPAHLAGQVAQR
jgi:hypothetical protein